MLGSGSRFSSPALQNVRRASSDPADRLTLAGSGAPAAAHATGSAQRVQRPADSTALVALRDLQPSEALVLLDDPTPEPAQTG